jgi:hypothetical protein
MRKRIKKQKPNQQSNNQPEATKKLRTQKKRTKGNKPGHKKDKRLRKYYVFSPENEEASEEIDLTLESVNLEGSLEEYFETCYSKQEGLEELNSRWPV